MFRLETKRLIIRPTNNIDVSKIHEMLSDEEVDHIINTVVAYYDTKKI